MNNIIENVFTVVINSLSKMIMGHLLIICLILFAIELDLNCIKNV